MDEDELAWAAGFFDGDGWAALSRPKVRRTGQPQARINQSSLDGVPEVLLRFRDAVGVGRIGGPKIEDGREPLYWWVASSRADVTRTGTAIGPWLSGAKRGQFRVAAGLDYDEAPLHSLAWAAGLFDAEGSTSLGWHRTHHGHRVLDASVTQGGRDEVPEELVLFLSLVALGKNYGPYLQEGANQPVYRWRLSRVDDIRLVLHLMSPWLGNVKRSQARSALMVIDAQPTLSRGRPDWGSHKTHCIHGHEYATARLRPYVNRGGVRRRENKQCLECTREQARLRRTLAKTKIDGQRAVDLDTDAEDPTC